MLGHVQAEGAAVQLGHRSTYRESSREGGPCNQGEKMGAESRESYLRLPYSHRSGRALADGFHQSPLYLPSKCLSRSDLSGFYFIAPTIPD